MGNIDLEALRARLQQRAECAARKGEIASVTVGPASDLPAWRCEVCWTRKDGISEWTGYAGSLDDLESNVSILIAVRRQGTFYFHADREPIAYVADGVKVCNPKHRHKTREEAEACDVTPDLPIVISLTCEIEPK